MIAVLKRAKTFHAFDRAATAIGSQTIAMSITEYDLIQFMKDLRFSQRWSWYNSK
jgi:hypothetical protein